jgi:hypothetical protein
MQLMQPSFALVRDTKAKCFLLFIRGAISTKERLTAATSVEVPFHHIVINNGQIDNVILGYAHCGMLTAARWIANLAIPLLRNAVREFPDYQVKVIFISSVFSASPRNIRKVKSYKLGKTARLLPLTFNDFILYYEVKCYQ